MTDDVVFKLDRSTVKVDVNGFVYREVRGEWKRVMKGMFVARAFARASNLRAIRRSSVEREAARSAS